MAKKKQIFIDVVVDDKGTTQRLAVDSDKLQKALTKADKAGLDQQRQMRGAANMSSNLTKNFSKMTQGISGGIVPAYAELAARVFAVTAAFRFLQEAADTRNLVEGQKAFGALVGTNFAGITKALQDATDGQLKFKDAAQAAAIGTAAGLTGTQLQKLAVAAKNTSFALGRDLTDSFNRLIRGVTKAEPELLDELGIILRLKPATEEFAASIGKTADSLTAFERSQAVANFVLDEAERKFAKIAEITDKDAFAIAQFGKAFDDILNTIKVGLAEGVTPVLKFLSKNISSLIALFGLLALPLVRSVLPNLDAFGEAAEDAQKAARKFAGEAQKDFDRLAAKAATLGKSQEAVAKQADKLAKSAGLSAEGASPGSAAGFLTGAGEGPTARGRAAADKALKNAEASLRNHAEVQKGIFKGMNAAQVADMRASYKMRERILKKHEMITKFSVKGMSITFDKFYAKTQLGAAKTFAFVSKQAKRAARGIDLAFKGAGLLGLGLMLIDLGKMAFDAFFPMSAAAKKAAEDVEELSTRTAELARHLSDVNELANSGDIFLTTTESVQQLGNAVKEANVIQLIRDIKGLDALGEKVGKNSDEFKELRERLKTTVTELAKMDKAFIPLIAALDDASILEGEVTEGITSRASEMVKAADAATQLKDAQKALNQEINNLLGSIPKAPLQSLITAFDKELELRITVQDEIDRAALERTVEKFNQQMAASLAKKSGTGTEEVEVFESGHRGRQNRKRGIKKTITRTIAVRSDADKEATRKLAAQFQQDLANIEKGKKIIDKDEKTRQRLVELADKQLDREEEILASKNAVARIDKISQSFDAQRVRAIIPVAQANEKVLAAKNAELSAQGALLTLEKKGSTASKEDIANADRAVELAKEATRVAEGELEQKTKKATIDQIEIAAAEKRLEITKEIFELENNLAIAKLAAQRATTPGKGTVGKNVFEIGAESQAAKENDLLAQQQIIIEKIQQANTRRAGLEAKNDAAGLAALDQEIARLAIRGASLALQLETEQNLVTNNIEAGRLALQRVEQENALISLNPVKEEAERRILELKLKGKQLTQDEIDAIFAQTEAMQEQAIIAEGLQNIKNSIQGGMENALMSLVDGTKSAKEAFADFAKGVLKSIAQMIIKMMVFNALKSVGMPGFKDGGITPKAPGARYGGIMDNYSTGGIARGRQSGYPVMLHGTEAVVPLPNKKEIPVEIRGGTGNQNNINITVATDGTTKTEGDTGNSNQAAQLGRVVSMAVQDELHKQKRPGGILSPFGAA